MSNRPKNTRLLVCLAGFALLFGASQAQARPFRPGMYPNGSTLNCAACHVNPGGGGPRTSFGKAVEAIVKGPSNTPFWSPTLAKLDSDGDGFTNGQEVGDPEGTGTAFSGAQVTNPGVSSSKPVAKPPQVAISSPSTGMTVSAPYSGSILVEAAANAGDLAKVEMMDGNELLGSLTAPPYAWNLNLTVPGTHTLVATATDYLGFSASSDPVTITVNAAAAANVVIQGFAFKPAEVTINVGETVTWTQKDTVQHTVTSDITPRILDSALLSVDQTYSFTFTSPGTYPYHCTPHPNMKGTVIVKDPNAATPIAITGIEKLEDAVEIAWTGGTGPYLLQKKNRLLDTNWFNVLTTAGQSLTVAQDGATGFYRVMDKATSMVVPFTVLLSGASEVPAVSTGAYGAGALSLEGMQLSYHIRYEDLSGNATAAHIHAPADAGHTAGVLFPLLGAAGPEGELTGSQTLTAEQLANILAGQAYVNIHTASNPGGEVRGQMVPLRLPVRLSGNGEQPPVTSTGSGDGWITLVGSRLFYDIDYRDLSAAATAAHVHGPADASHTAGVAFPLNGDKATSGTLEGSQNLTPELLTNLLSGLTYANIHTGNNPGGEIRGQIYPWHFTATLTGAAEVPAVSPAGSGSGSLWLSGNQLTYSIAYSGLTSAANNAHIHGPADTTQSAGVLIPLDGAAGTSGTLSGTVAVTPEQLANLLAGKTYVNIHTANNPTGEIRGQVMLRQ